MSPTGCPPLRAVRTYTDKHGNVGKSSLATPVANDDGKLQHSYRAIAGALGVDPKTVWKDVKNPTVDDSTVDLPADVIGIDGKVKPLLEEEARERQLSGLRKGTKSPLATVVANGEVGLHKANDLAGATVGVSGKGVLPTSVGKRASGEANDLAGATVGVSGKGAAPLTVCLRAAPEMAVAPASPGPPLSLVCLWRVEGRRVDH